MKVYLDNFSIIFWDFDGVVKDSVSAKTSAFEKLFMPYGQKIAEKVKQHHEANGGMSRFKKIPLYLSWAGEEVNHEIVDKFCNLFSKAVLQSVIESPWVSGVYEYLHNNFKEKYFVLVTATPQDEIERIIYTLKISQYFQQVIGAPTNKEDAIRSVLKEQKIIPAQVLMIGDAETDLLAAQANSISFLLRRTPQNIHIQSCYDGPKFDNLSYE